MSELAADLLADKLSACWGGEMVVVVRGGLEGVGEG